MSRERAPRALGGGSGTVHPLAVVSLASSVLAYGSAFVGSAALIWPGIVVALAGVVTGLLARRGIAKDPATHGGKALATAGILSGAVFVLLGVLLYRLAAGAAGAG